MSRARLAAPLALLLLGAGPGAKVLPSLFPDGTFTPFEANWYSEQLAALKEKRLELNGVETYRFTWLRTFHHPITIRVELRQDHAVITVREADGAGGYKPGKVIRDETKNLTTAERDGLVRKLSAGDFWTLPTSRKDLGCDGAEWILEAVKAGKYHAVDRWCPADGREAGDGRFADACKEFLRLAEVSVPKDEMY